MNKNLSIKIIVIIILQVFCITQAGWAAPIVIGRNLRPAQAIGDGTTGAAANGILAELKGPVGAAATGKILVVDDDPAMRLLAQRALDKDYRKGGFIYR